MRNQRIETDLRASSEPHPRALNTNKPLNTSHNIQSPCDSAVNSTKTQSHLQPIQLHTTSSSPIPVPAAIVVRGVEFTLVPQLRKVVQATTHLPTMLALSVTMSLTIARVHSSILLIELMIERSIIVCVILSLTASG
jgi:hypothetical protein